MKSCDVAIVGYGPVGQALAAYLGRAGITVAVFERDRYVFERARTGGTDDESLRFFQRLGLAQTIIAGLEEGTRVPGTMRFVNRDDQVLLNWPAGEPGPNGYRRLYMWHQPEVDRIVREYVDSLAGVAVHLEHEVEAVEAAADSVIVRARDRRSGAAVECDARYVVGCDGARSTVRAAVGAKFESLAASQGWVVVDLTLTRAVDSLPDEMVHYCDPRRPITYIRNVGNRRRWEFMVMPDEDPATMDAPAKVWELLAPWLGPDDAEIYRAVSYTFHSLLADRWRNGRLLLAGDAAHLMPPFLGQGLCSGLRDVRNLAWKLAAVLDGRAPEELLDTYGSERSPHVRELIELSDRVSGIIQTIDPEVAAKRDAEMLADGGGALHTPFPQLGPGLLPATAEAPLGTLFAQPRLADGRLLDDAVGEQFTILALPELVASLAPGLRERCRDAGVAILGDASPETRTALAAVGARGVLLRPDKYLLGVADSGEDLGRLVELVPGSAAPALDPAR
ncbi:MAG: bifunctional 3-(3-hydroxy-phenyl)propionate/3-hydroxycinnamic acid hydroxylase [Actinobacteria bacterium]|nr:bifunctional 3-(3-hydroxy-phenyl)propionate/3-hydroxycinnamic acid hydroxylase [Actinomycetota bacterium]